MILLSHTHTHKNGKKKKKDDRDDVGPIIMKTINKNENEIKGNW